MGQLSTVHHNNEQLSLAAAFIPAQFIFIYIYSESQNAINFHFPATDSWNGIELDRSINSERRNIQVPGKERGLVELEPQTHIEYRFVQHLLIKLSKNILGIAMLTVSPFPCEAPNRGANRVTWTKSDSGLSKSHSSNLTLKGENDCPSMKSLLSFQKCKQCQSHSK